MPSFRSSRRCPGAFPSRAILKRAGEYRQPLLFLPRPRAAPRPAARSVRTPRPRLFTPAAAPFSLPSAARTNIARGRPVPTTGLDAPAAGLRRPLTAPFRLRKGEPPPGVGTGNRGLSPLSSASFRGGKGAMPSSFGELRAVRKAAGAGAGDAKPALSFFGAGVTTPRRSSAACRCRAVSGRSGRTAPLRCGRSDSASAPGGRIGG